MSRKKSKKNRGRETTRIGIEGTIHVTARGRGFVSAEEYEEDIIIAPENLNTALNNDRVRIALLPVLREEPRKAARKTGEVLEILTRCKTEFVGTLKKEGGVYFLEPQGREMYTNIVIPAGKIKDARPEDKVLVKMHEWSDPAKNPVGEVLKKIGKAGTHETEMRSILLEKGFDLRFPRAVRREADEVKENYPKLFEIEEKKRRDFRGVPTFTIDPENAKDFDDALSIRELPNGNFEVGIHIADVSFFVRPDTKLDQEAARRSTSVYLVDRTIPMLPEVLSNDLCSLNPDEDKLAFSAVFEMTPHAEVRKRWFGKTIIRSQKRFAYEAAQNVLDAKEGTFYQELRRLHEISKIMRKRRFARGAIAFSERSEVYFELNEHGKPVKIIPKIILDTNRLIEDFMILANSEVASFTSGKDEKIKKTFVYRIHELPDEDKLKEIARLMRALGYEVPKKKKRRFKAEEINALLEQIRGEIHEEMITMAVIQAMAKAVYSTKNVGHFGLSLHHYTHFTSPIRRYPDLVVHRLLQRYLSGKKIGARDLETYEAISRYASQMEATADEAERASIKYKQAEYMAERIGEVFDGVITGISERGIFVEETKSKSEGLVRMRDLGDDYYVLEEKNYRLIGKRTKKIYSLGGKVKVKVIGANPDKRRIDFQIEEKK